MAREEQTTDAELERRGVVSFPAPELAEEIAS
jgi:hypothetical protein